MKNEAEFEADIRLVTERLFAKVAQEETAKGTLEFSTFDVSKYESFGFSNELVYELFSDKKQLPAILVEVEKRSNGRVELKSPIPHQITLATHNQDFLDDNFERDLQVFDAYKINYSKNSNIPPEKKGLIFYLHDDKIYHYEKGQIGKDDATKSSPTGYYSLLKKLLEQYENGGENIPFSKIRKGIRFERIYGALANNGNGLWRVLNIKNIHPTDPLGKTKVINVSQGTKSITFNNKVN